MRPMRPMRTVRPIRTDNMCSRRQRQVFTGVQRMLVLGVVLLACTLAVQHADALPAYDFLLKPPEEGVMIAEDNECYRNADVETLCQRCAKSTKANMVYPMCCEDKEAAREWCKSYLNFGIK